MTNPQLRPAHGELGAPIEPLEAAIVQGPMAKGRLEGSAGPCRFGFDPETVWLADAERKAGPSGHVHDAASRRPDVKRCSFAKRLSPGARRQRRDTGPQERNGLGWRQRGATARVRNPPRQRRLRSARSGDAGAGIIGEVLVEAKMRCFKLLAERVMARSPDFDRQVGRTAVSGLQS